MWVNSYTKAAIKAWLPRRDSGFFLLLSPRKKFLKNFQKLDEILLKIFHCIIESTWKALLEVCDVRIKNSTFFEKRYKNWEFQVWLQLEGEKIARKIFKLFEEKWHPSLCLFSEGLSKSFSWVFRPSGQSNIQTRWHPMQPKLPFL